MKKYILFIVLTQLLAIVCLAQVEVKNPLCENRNNPLGLDVHQPMLSWQLISASRNTMQTAYEIRVAEKMEDLVKGKNLVWNTGKVLTDQSVHVPYAGSPLQSEKKYYWQVRIWDNTGKASAWSAMALWQMALLRTSDWKAKWIEPGYVEDTVMRPSPLFRKEFLANKKVVSATAYITAHGLYEAEINGQQVGDAYLTPGWTSYKNRLQYQVYDVKTLLKNGANAIGVTLGNGWYRGIIGFGNNINVYGKDIALLFQMNITYSDGSTDTVISNDSWKSSAGAIRYDEIYNGETIDVRKEKKGWTLPGYDDAKWSGVTIADYSKDVLLATYNEPVKKHETFKPVRIFKTPKGEQVIDFGQNLVGWVVVKVKGNAGDTITISHAEVLDKEGNFYTTNLREAKAQDNYILKGGEVETFEPHFTWHGFRFIKVEVIPTY